MKRVWILKTIVALSGHWALAQGANPHEADETASRQAVGAYDDEGHRGGAPAGARQ